MNLFSKNNSYPIISIGKFLNQLYIIIQPWRTISSWRLFQRLNSSRVILRTNTYKAEISCYIPRRVVRANRRDSIVSPSKVHSILISRKCEVHVTPEVKDYVISVTCKNSLTNFSSVSNPTLIISKCSDVIPSKFKAIKFTL